MTLSTDLPTSIPEQRTSTETIEPGEPEAPRNRRRYVGWGLTVLAGVILLFTLVLPNEFRNFTPAWFLRIPVEALLGTAIVLAVPRRFGRIAAVLAGVAVGIVTILKVIDMFFILFMLRSADPVLDWTLLGNGMDFITESYGKAGAAGTVLVVALLIGAVLAVTIWSTLRLTRLVVTHRRNAAVTALVLAVAWVLLAVTNIEIVPGEPVAAKSATGYTYYRALQARKSMQDKETFAREAAVDAFAGVPSTDLLTGLRGKDVVFAFVESYGFSAATDPRYQSEIGAVVDEGQKRLQAAGYASRSGFLTSPTAGGGSWFAHATFLSGLWIDNQQRYKSLVSSNRMTLGKAFQKADWDTVGVMPGIIRKWPEGEYFGYERVYGKEALGYRGPRFGFAPMPDQYTLAQFQKQERGKSGRSPLMAEIELISSHTPWATPPNLVDWNAVGDGSRGFQPPSGDDGGSLLGGTAQARAAYAKTIGYSLRSLISYVETYGDDNLVLVFLGDHQPTGNVTDNSRNFTVPITIVARDTAILDRTASWGWQDGLRPRPDAPVWKMSDFRDRFLTAFAK
ncbi:sulfatase [Virgisporangium aurantiacum]|uniref:Phosphoglycerol transferase MdoB n=1 Tax=Virgisporangium aurantiacum TaxID=175570 RepID=A0A8J4E4B5_9ACTN|nr:sulfatase [Virgisporangium aurantiacum]GIJ60838.1 hypothetical protein Vau01_083540 [Virgisporangium aurantiacum]